MTNDGVNIPVGIVWRDYVLCGYVRYPYDKLILIAPRSVHRGKYMRRSISEIPTDILEMIRDKMEVISLTGVYENNYLQMSFSSDIIIDPAKVIDDELAERILLEK